MQRWLWGRWLLFVSCMLFILTNCQPEVAPASRPAPSSIPPGPVASPISPSSAPTTVIQSPLSSPQAPTVAAPAQSTSGIHITVSIGPTCPGPSRAGESCERPYAGEFVITTNAGEEVAHVTTSGTGQATVDLPPGEYTVRLKLDSKVPYPRSAPVNVIVPPGRYVDVSIQLDTGIR